VYMLAALATGNAHAQTVVGATNSNTIVQGASSTTIKSQYTRIEGGSQVTIAAPNTEVQGTLRVTGPINAASINLASPAGTLNVASELLANKQALTGKASLGQVNAVNEQVNVVRNSVTNLGDDVVRNASASADRDADLDTRKADKTAVESEVTRVDGRIDTTNGRVTSVEGKVVNLRTDLTDETAARIEGDKRAATAANAYADAGDAATLSAAQGYADAGDQRTLNAAQNYADAGDRRTLGQANAYTDQQIGAVRHEVAQVRKQVDAVGAVAMAASVVGGVSVADGKKTAVTAAVGSYGNSTAIAVGVTHIVAPNKRLFGTISRASGSKTGMGLGASFSF